MNRGNGVSEHPFYSEAWVGDMAAYWLNSGYAVDTHHGIPGPIDRSLRETMLVELDAETVRLLAASEVLS